ncbi:MAG: hypothetical protein BGO31_20700 [Bacteroidetes bacterium 43-16]|uniref:hypothetical protein n=1 Tax=uncultured Dysgonomonas sp. TaxID=206096 RepID=UPI000929DE5C|nr:hypothetical protein [uncultured Dysgonomonas sp.]OJV55352.1 MAG: hypothetical protein BGO31_20700 [Bacteroidetes bacterium 43-16]
MKKQNIQNSDYPKREKNFLSTVTSEDTFQVIVGHADNNNILLWHDEYYMEAYLSACKTPITLSKVDTVIFLKWMKGNHQEMSYFIHPIFGKESPKLNTKEVTEKIIDKMESDGDWYDSLRENGIL